MEKAHFVVQRADLVRELALISNVVGRQTAIPILANVRIGADGDHLMLAGTDLDIGLACRTSAEVKAPGAATLPAKRLLDYVRLLPDGPIDFRFSENNWAGITSVAERTTASRSTISPPPTAEQCSKSLVTPSPAFRGIGPASNAARQTALHQR